jgi:hypothetical protein
MLTGEIEIEHLARVMIERHSGHAATVAVAQLNKTIDRGDWEGRERWACVVRAIHEHQCQDPASLSRSVDAGRIAQIVRDFPEIARSTA